MHFEHTIAAISTPPGTGAIAIVRMSGPQAFHIIGQIFSNQTHPENLISKLTSHLARHGYILNPLSQEIIDEVVVVPYQGPHTYTGEDLVEISCHGGPVVTKEILTLCLHQGAHLAQPGEFTQRAFLSGRIDLTQAEAVLDLIQAKTGRHGRGAISALSGKLGINIKKIRASLITLLTQVVAGIDFPEEVGDTPASEIASHVDSSLAQLQDLYKTARSGHFLREGLRIAIVGRPNAGKSSLLNQLLKFDRAIVTDIPGTTRDALEELLDLNGIPIILVDTAGIRPTEDRVERIGIERTIQAIAQSDLVLLVSDLSAGWGLPEEEITTIIGSRPFILLQNKADIYANIRADSSNKDESKINSFNNIVDAIKISAITGLGIDALKATVENWVFQDETNRDGHASLNTRQAELCAKAITALTLVQKALVDGLPQDCLATDLKGTIDALSEICGEAVSEEIIHQVFANFCIGK